MVIELKKTYSQTPSKIRTLWGIAHRLIGMYEDFDRKLKEFEKKIDEMAKKINQLAEKFYDF